MSLNGPCVTVYKTKGDPLISAWDSAGTVAPGIYSESACRPNFLQVENPARFVRGADARLVQTLTWNYLLVVNCRLLVWPLVLLADYSHDTIPLIRSLRDARNLATVGFWAAFLALVLFCVRQLVIGPVRADGGAGGAGGKAAAARSRLVPG